MTGNEKNSKKKIRISIIDVLIVVTVIACIVGSFVHFKIFEKKNAVVTDEKALVSVMFCGVSNEIAEKMVAGDKIYFDDDDTLFGTVVEAVPENAEVYFKDSLGKIALVEDESKKDISVMVEVDGDFSADGFLANGVKYTASGMEIEVFTSRFSGKGLIFDVKKQAE